MANLKEIRSRITSVSSTMQITSAMKMVSAAKLRRAQDAITRMRPYSEKLNEILANLSSSLDVSENVYGEERDGKRVLIVAITSNRGLCGGFNNAVIKDVKRMLNNELKSHDVNILPLGKKANDAFKASGMINTAKVYGDWDAGDVYSNLTFEHVSEIANHVMEAYAENKYDKVILVYNRFKNAAVQILETEQFLPIRQPEGEQKVSTDYIFEPDKEEIVNDIIPKSLRIQLFAALLDSHAAEHGARMTAMHKATDNASELKKELKLTYNKVRQAAITTEILEIVAGAEALND